jgi:hypothetical protein
MSEETLKKLRQMKLYGMANALETNLANTQRENLSCDVLTPAINVTTKQEKVIPPL